MFFQQTSAAVKASYEVSLMIAQKKKAQITWKNFVLSAAVVIIHFILKDKSVKKLNSTFLSNNTGQQQIKEKSAEILQQVISEICRSKSAKSNETSINQLQKEKGDTFTTYFEIYT